MATTVQRPWPVTQLRHEQTTPSATWTIKHGMYSYPVVDVYIDIEGGTQKVLAESITYVDPTTITITFSEPRTGFATVS